ncbi:hypothetical protein M9H77_04446 [Catharanthus roseus]|uniref:Uncharacterized protein n=1 Tax=Catharanthus roseus TaxID=4058 RepID=A0ACC0CEN3_CATRO|nr:hypothetical protein M9H77_04446 [Catharanthus roseus]
MWDDMAVNEENILESHAKKVENSSQPWYDAYKNCLRSVRKTDGEVESRSCLETKAIPRYLLKLNIIQREQSAKVTLFKDVASIVIGCSSIEYIDSIENFSAISSVAATVNRYSWLTASLGGL